MVENMHYEKSKSLIDNDRNKMKIACLETLVPQDHILRKIDQAIDEKTGEIKEKDNNNIQEISVSTTDDECGMFVKGEHERQFAYVDQVACDKHGWVLGYEVNPGNVHDSKAFLPFFENKLLRYKPAVCCCDVGYVNALIAHYVQEKNANY